MGTKRNLYSNGNKHRWHLSYGKAKRLNRLFDQIENGMGKEIQTPADMPCEINIEKGGKRDVEVNA